MQITETTRGYECCCSCKHNIRKQDDKMAGINCECEIDGHYIGYVSCFSNVCEEWEEDNGVSN